MRKLALLVAVVLAAAFSAKSDVALAQAGQDMNPSTTKFIGDAMNPYVTTQPAPAAKAKKAKKKKK
jgi:hypothetical protein